VRTLRKVNIEIVKLFDSVGTGLALSEKKGNKYPQAIALTQTGKSANSPLIRGVDAYLLCRKGFLYYQIVNITTRIPQGMHRSVARHNPQLFFKGRTEMDRYSRGSEHRPLFKSEETRIIQYAMFVDCGYYSMSRRPYSILVGQCIATNSYISSRCVWLFFSICLFINPIVNITTRIPQGMHRSVAKHNPLIFFKGRTEMDRHSRGSEHRPFLI